MKGWMLKVLQSGPYDDAKGWLRGLTITVAAAGFLAWGGAFGSDRASSAAARFGCWLVLMILGWLWGAFVSRFVFRRIKRPMSLWMRVAVASLLLAIPYSAVVAFVTHLAFGSHYGLAEIPDLILTVTAIAAVMITLNVLVDRQSGVTTASSAPPKFLDRLPLKLRGAEVWAVEAQDHYLRLHTSKGQDLILMRLADAIAELEGIEGAQVHRSWWIARNAIADARRGDGRAMLTLKDGAEAPVSRTYARVLRERGWI